MAFKGSGAKVIFALAPNGNELRFNSIKEAGNTLKCNPANISMVVNGVYVHHHGYKFRFENQDYNNKPILTTSEKAEIARARLIERFKKLSQSRTKGNLRECRNCKEYKTIDSYWNHIHTKANGDKVKYKCWLCIDCYNKTKGTKNPGIHKVSADLLIQGKIRCATCKETKTVDQYCKNKSRKCGYNASCKKCMSVEHDKFYKREKNNLSDKYLNIYLINKYGLPSRLATQELRDVAKAEILAIRESKTMLKFEGKTFSSVRGLANYIQNKYGIDSGRTEGRLQKSAATPEQCLISESEWRSKAYTKGEIESTCQQTGEVRLHKTLRECCKDLHIGQLMVNQCLKTGEASRLYKNTVKFTYKFKRNEKR